MSNQNNTVFYTGVTNELIKRAYQHRNKLVDGFTKKYNCTKLVYYELFDGILDAIQREKQIKGGSRAKKLVLVKSMNPTFDDLYERLF